MDIQKVKEAREVVKQAEEEVLEYVKEYMKDGITINAQDALWNFDGYETGTEKHGLKIFLIFHAKSKKSGIECYCTISCPAIGMKVSKAVYPKHIYCDKDTGKIKPMQVFLTDFKLY